MSNHEKNFAVSDKQLLRDVIENKPEAETNLIKRYADTIRGFLLRKTKNPASADDLFQETFGTALIKIRSGKVGQPEKLSGYIYRIARNLFLAHYRRESSRIKRVGCLEHCHLADPGATPYQALARREEARLVYQILAELSHERDRQILLRFYLGEEDRDVICADLGIGDAQFNLVLHRARTRFRDLWQKHQKKMKLTRCHIQ